MSSSQSFKGSAEVPTLLSESLRGLEDERHAASHGRAPAEADHLRAPGDQRPEIDDGVIEEARRRQQRRRLVGLSIISMAGLIAAGLIDSSGPPQRSHRQALAATAAPSATTDSATAMLAQEPRLGVACGVPNSIKCDRVGLAVWLRRPALSVTATVAGEPVELDDPTWSGPARNGRRMMFAGFLQPAGMLNGPLKVHPDRGRFWWAGGHPAPARLRIVANYGNGHRTSATTTVLLAGGWG
jgi:hypothetical protein